MSSLRITIDISAENDDFEDPIREAMKGILAGNKSWRNENDTESYSFSVVNVYHPDQTTRF